MIWSQTLTVKGRWLGGGLGFLGCWASKVWRPLLVSEEICVLPFRRGYRTASFSALIAEFVRLWGSLTLLSGTCFFCICSCSPYNLPRALLLISFAFQSTPNSKQTLHFNLTPDSRHRYQTLPPTPIKAISSFSSLSYLVSGQDYDAAHCTMSIQLMRRCSSAWCLVLFFAITTLGGCCWRLKW